MSCFHELYCVKTQFSTPDYEYLTQQILSERYMESENRSNTIGVSSLYEAGKTSISAIQVLSSLIRFDQIEITLDDGSGELIYPTVIIAGSGKLDFGQLLYLLPGSISNEFLRLISEQHSGMYPAGRIMEVWIEFKRDPEDKSEELDYSKYVFEMHVECLSDHFKSCVRWPRNPNRMLSYQANFPIPTQFLEDVAYDYARKSKIYRYLSEKEQVCS